MEVKDAVCMGIDIGGTHTDTVVLDAQGSILSQDKQRTQRNLCLKDLLERIPPSLRHLPVGIGTTLGTNALLRTESLSRVALIRLASQNPLLPPCPEWSPTCRENLLLGQETMGGGYEMDGTPLGAVDVERVERILGPFLEKGCKTLVVQSVFGTIYPQQEELVRQMALEMGFAYVSCGSSFPDFPWLPRETLAVANGLLLPLFEDFLQDKEKFPGKVSFVFDQGECVSAETVLEKPVFTVFSGPVNSLVGGAFLAGVSNALVIDIGGTSTDIGMVLDGHLYKGLQGSWVGGIPLNSHGPTLVSLPIGGDGYGGKGQMEKAWKQIRQRVRDFQGYHGDLPWVLVGGGSSLLSESFLMEESRIQKLSLIRPAGYSVANAVGAALQRMGTKTLEPVGRPL